MVAQCLSFFCGEVMVQVPTVLSKCAMLLCPLAPIPAPFPVQQNDGSCRCGYALYTWRTHAPCSGEEIVDHLSRLLF